jgi:hypothetical protein
LRKASSNIYENSKGISVARVKGFTSENVARFFDIYEPELGKVNHPVHRIFNADETGINCATQEQ